MKGDEVYEEIEEIIDSFFERINDVGHTHYCNRCYGNSESG